ncbi:glycosyltransferase [Roseiarcaceae bacterium H3SJ34-1]|uniref:glycosyltransferase n=1 Tax=Terripilifer ovatus TaxID=3032367 RepID=UPI003AB92F4F|nr:glycosyltransferase [Roseiarcaceae bacterium H3SJ34-1]
MSIEVLLAIVFVAVLVAIQLVSTAIAIVRCPPGARPAAVSGPHPGISIVRPLCGLETFSAQTLEATFAIDWPEYEVLFCVADADDPIVGLARAAIAKHPEIPARLLIGAERLGSNPKLNNMASGWRAARYDIVVFTDSNLLVGADYLHRLMASWRDGAGMVTSPAFGASPQGFWAHVECAMLNTYQARIQYAVDTLGFGFAQGKSLMFRRRDLERGGFETLASEPAEDAASTKMMRSKAADIAVAGPPYPQPLGHRTFRQVWNRHLRWARLRRASFPVLFAPEIFSGVLPPVAAVLFVAVELGWSPLLAGAGLLGVWYVPELLLARIAGWPLAWTSLPAVVLRDALLPVLYCSAFSGRSVSWNGNQVDLNAMPKNRSPELTPRLRPQLLSAVILAGSLRMPRVASHLQRLADRF